MDVSKYRGTPTAWPRRFAAREDTVKSRTYSRLLERGLRTSLVSVAAFVAALSPALPQEAPPADTSVAPPQAASPAGAQSAQGMKVYIDPRTGAILREPAPGTVPLQVSPADQNALSTSHEGLVEVPSSVPGAGVGLNLQGRFQSPLFATIDANGKVRVQHLNEPPQADHETHDH
jgi:hypothetical protein